MRLGRKKSEPAAAPPKEDSRQIHATDDLLVRAENIVWMLGYRGAVGGIVLAVFKALRDYDRLDRQAEKLPSGESASTP